MALKIGIIGQSNGVNMRAEAYGDTLTAAANLKLWNGATYEVPTFGDGQISFGNDLIDKYSTDVFMINSAVGNTSLLAASAPAEGYWLDPSSLALYDEFKTDVMDAEGVLELDLIIYWQGVRDAQQGTTSAAYKQGLLDLITIIRSDFQTPSGGDVPIIIPQLISRLGTSEIDADWRGIRQAARDATAETTLCEYAASFLDLPHDVGDNNHINGIGQLQAGRRLSLAYQFITGMSSYIRGPSISQFTSVDKTTTDVTIAYTAGSNFTPTSSITGFQLSADGFTTEVDNLTGVQLSSSRLRLTHSDLALTDRALAYNSNADVDITGAIHDNSAYLLPLEWDFNLTGAIVPMSDTNNIGYPPEAGEDQGSIETDVLNALQSFRHYDNTSGTINSTIYESNYESVSGGETVDRGRAMVNNNTGGDKIMSLGLVESDNAIIGNGDSTPWAIVATASVNVPGITSQTPIEFTFAMDAPYELVAGKVYNAIIFHVANNCYVGSTNTGPSSYTDNANGGIPPSDYVPVTQTSRNHIVSFDITQIPTGSPKKPTPYSDLTNLPGAAGQQDLSSDWIGASTFQISGLPQGAHQVGSSALVGFTFPSVNGWYDLAGVNVVALSSEGIQSEIESFTWTVSNRMAANFTQKPQVLSDPFDNTNTAGNPVTVLRGAMASAQWSQISFKVFDAAGDPINTATGVISGKSRTSGQGGFSDFAATLDLNADDWVFAANQGSVAEFEFSIVGLNANYTVVATVTSWN